MAHRYINELQPGETLADQIFLIGSKDLRRTTNGDLYIHAVLVDKTGQMPARAWQATEQQYKLMPEGEFLRLRGRCESYKGKLQFIIEGLSAVQEEEVSLEDFLPATERDVEQMWSRVKAILRTIKDQDLLQLIKCYVEDEALVRKLKRAPAAVVMHHAYLGGLLEHTLNLLELAEVVMPRYPELSQDLVYAGLFLHDIGKTEELEYRTNFKYSDAGQLLGHIAQSVMWIEDKVRQVEQQAGRAFPLEKKWALQHIVLSHHGQYEFGSPKLPATPEAIAVHYLDNLDAKIHLAVSAIQNDADEDSDWTQYLRSMETRLYKRNVVPEGNQLAMDYTQLTDHDVRKMLDTIGVERIDDLFSGIDDDHRVPGLLDIPAGLSEPEILADLQRLASNNISTGEQISFLGAGIYDHFIPTLVDALAMRGEFVTAYTPYQAEASQGILQAFYEFQTMVCQLTAMDVANASLYEMASAAAEAMFMAQAITGRDGIVVAEAAHPDLRRVLQTYAAQSDIKLSVAGFRDGATAMDQLTAHVDSHTAAVLVQHPNFFGSLEDIDAAVRTAHDAGALLIVAVDPVSCAFLKRPGDYEADIVVAEGQPLGIPQSYGGPALGLMACRKAYLRKLPGRIVGRTRDGQGRTAFCLTLQAREQHIRREKASSNICTNQGLLAMRAAVYMSAMGRHGLAEVARQAFQKAHYAAERIARLDGFEPAFGAPFFKEFVIRSSKDVAQVLRACQSDGILPGVALGRWFPDLSDCFMVAVTERRTRQEIDRLTDVLGAV